MNVDNLNKTELKLLYFIERECHKRNGVARSLAFVGMKLAGMEYSQAWEALNALEAAGCVEVSNRGGSELEMRVIE